MIHFNKSTGAVPADMMNRLAARNVKKSAKDYFIYFFTLMLSVCLFYSFNSISTQFASLGLEDPLNYLAFSSGVLTAFSILVCIIMGALVVYANRFLLRRRKKEMGVYASLGMERSDLNKMLMKETFFIGIFSLLAGLILGIFAGQILSLATAKLIGLSLSNYSFMISAKAIILSVIFFGILFFFVHLFNVKELGKMSLLDMLYADRKNETVSEGKSGILTFFALLSLILIFGGYAVLIQMSGVEAFKALGIGGGTADCRNGMFLPRGAQNCGKDDEEKPGILLPWTEYVYCKPIFYPSENGGKISFHDSHTFVSVNILDDNWAWNGKIRNEWGGNGNSVYRNNFLFFSS